MSITLPFVDLSSAVVGTTGTIPLQAAGLVAVPSQQPPFLAISNDSGAGVLITLTVSQQQFYLSAKGHILVAISNKEREIAYSVQNISTNIQVNQLWAVYFYPGEEVTDFSAMGTSAVSQQATTLVNVGNPVGTSIIFSEPLGDSNPSGAINITNSGLIEAGDTTNSGKILVSGTHVSLAATNNIFPDEMAILGTTNQKVDLLVSGVDASATLSNQSGSSKVVLQTASPGLDLSGLFSGAIALQLLAGSLSRIKFGSVSATTGGVAVTHGLGATPDIVLLTVNNLTASVTATVSNVGATTFTVTSSTATGVYWCAIKS
jgi:hypothetical protein